MVAPHEIPRKEPHEEVVLLDLEIALNEAEDKAWQSLAKEKFIVAGYWMEMWEHLNRIGEFNKPNPFKPLVNLANSMVSEQYKRARALVE